MFHGIMTNGNNSLRFEDSAMTSSIHHEDTGFCSGEDYMEHEIHSPTDSSEDSVEVKVSAITLNKRKLEETPTIFSGPLKKRMCLKVQAEANNNGKTPFRPWSPPKNSNNFAVPFPRIKVETPSFSPNLKETNFSYFRPPSPLQQTEPLPLVIKREKEPQKTDIRVPVHPHVGKMTIAETERMILKTNEHFPGLKPTTFNNDNRKTSVETKREQRNYKNMTRERRIEANARERTRVHTISAAFDTLRQSVPAYSNNQKLSKLSVLRIACSYIMTLSSIVNESDNTSDPDQPSTSECVDLVSRTIQREGKLRKKKDDND
ncbi:unnamed protein product [Ceutorhynchus assimilis]|uniref:BHLH domain-containing protein n=1 Tax=Ceutorhynchus assimilis TaxID=467358 RepID=A0A9N9MUB5_9CUCU|nr:unnamed protein product [Ceutorhynchus assimilis]